MVCSGTAENFKEKLNLQAEGEEKWGNILKKFIDKGMIPYVYCRRELIKEEAEIFKKKYNNLKTSLINQSDQLEKLAEELETNLHVVSIIGLKEKLRAEVPKMISFFQCLNLNTWVLTGDTKEKAIFAAQSAGIIQEKDLSFSIVSTKKEELLFSLQSILSDLKNYAINKDKSRKRNFRTFKTYFKECENYLIVNGGSVSVIFCDPFLKANFIFITSLIRTIIAYDMTPHEKFLLTRMVQKEFDKNPSVMAIGNGFNDISMLQEADFGVELINSEVSNPAILMAGDIRLSNMKTLKFLMLEHALTFADRINHIIYVLFYKSLLLGLQIFLFNFYNQFSGSNFYDGVFIFLYYNCFFVVNIAFLCLNYQDIKPKTIRKIPKLYVQGICYKKNKKIKTDLLRLFFETTTQCIFIFYVSIYTTSNTKSLEGHTHDKIATSLICLYSTLILTLSKVTKKIKKLSQKIALIKVLLNFKSTI